MQVGDVKVGVGEGDMQKPCINYEKSAPMKQMSTRVVEADGG